MIKIDIKGSCITREAFNFTDKYKVNNYWFQKPLITLVSKPCLNCEEVLDDVELYLLNKNQKMFMIKKFKQTLIKDYFNEYIPADYFILDLIDERLKLTKINNETYIEYEKGISEILSKKYNIETVINNFELWKQGCDEFFKRLLEFYDEDKIILHKGYALNGCDIDGEQYQLADFIDKDTYQFDYLNRDAQIKENQFFSRCYKYILKKYPKIKVIELEMDRYGCDPDHRLLRSFYHYENQYYLDFNKRLEEIVLGNYSLETVNKIKNHNESILKRDIIGRKEFKENLKIMEDFKGNILEKFDLFIKELKHDDFIKDHYANKEVVYKYPNGNINIKEYYDKDTIIKRELYNYNGSLKEIVMLKNNKITEQFIYQNNFLAFKYEYTKDGFLDKFTEYYHNGNIKIQLVYGEFSRIGKVYSETKYNLNGKKVFFVRYFSNGDKYAENVYNPPGVTEKCIYYSKNGDVISEKFFKSTKVCKEIDYYPNNDKLIFKEVEYFDTGIQKSIKKYNTTGQVISHLIRENEKSTFKKIENI